MTSHSSVVLWNTRRVYARDGIFNKNVCYVTDKGLLKMYIYKKKIVIILRAQCSAGRFDDSSRAAAANIAL